MTSDRDERFGELLAECHEAVVQNCHPASQPGWSVDPTDALATRLQRGIQGLELLEQYRRGRPTASTGGDSLPPDTLLDGHGDELPLKQLGRFRIDREIGRGGHGIVFLAFDEALQRRVALKVPRPECLLSQQLRHRFLREAQAVARLTHPNLLSIYESGEDGPLCFLASTYCTGPTLAQWLKRQKQPVPERLAATIIEALADGVAYANERGVLHRDIKPSNVFLDAAPQGFIPVIEPQQPETAGSAPRQTLCVPKLGDFGLARLADDTSNATRTGAAIGTPGYMAPEQARGDHAQIGSATDVYGLGTILFELLAGRAVFRGRNDIDIARQVVADEAPALRSIRGDASLDLAAICRMCLEKDPADRYPNASALTADLARYLRGAPTVARPLSRAERMRKWARRNPDWAWASGLAIAASLAFMTLLTWSNFQRMSERDNAVAHATIAETRRAEAETAELQARRQQYVAGIQLAARAVDAGQRRSAIDTLRELIPAKNQIDLRNGAWTYLWQRLFGFERELVGHDGEIGGIAYSPDDSLLATASWDGTARIWNAADGTVRAVLKGHQGHVNCVAFTTNREQLLTGGDDGTLKCWTTTGELLATIPAHQGDLLCLAVSKDGRWWATGGVDGTVRVWSSHDHQQLMELKGHTDWVRSVAFTDDCMHLVSASDDETLRIWGISPRGGPVVIEQKNKAVAVAITPDGKTIASGDDNRIRFWDMASGAEQKSWSVPNRIGALRFCAGGKFLLVGHGANASIYNVQNQSVERIILAQDKKLTCLAMSSDETRLACGGHEYRAQVWPMDCVAGGSAFVRVPGRGHGISVAQTGNTLAVLYDRQVAAYDRSTGTLLWNSAIPGQDFGEPIEAEFSPDSREIAVSGSFGPIARFDAETGAPLVALVGNREGNFHLAYHPQAKTLASSSGDGCVRIWNLATGVVQHELRIPSGQLIGDLIFSPDGEMLVGGCGHDGAVYSWDTKDYRLLGSLQPGHYSIAFSRQGLLASFDPQCAIQLWNLKERRRIKTFASQSQGQLTFSPDGGLLLATQATTGLVGFWDVDTAQELLTAHLRQVGRVAFSPDGAELYALSNDLLAGANVSQITLSPTRCPTEPQEAVAQSAGFIPLQTMAPAPVAQTHDYLESCVQVKLSSYNDFASCVLRQTDGRILVFGQSLMGDSHDLVLARFHADGTVDNSFGTAGLVKINMPGRSSIYAALQTDQCVLIAATVTATGAKEGETSIVAMRVRPDGSLDDSFGAAGRTEIKFASSSHVECMTVDAQGRAVLVGSVRNETREHFAVARLLPNGKPDPTFGDNGRVTTAFEGTDEAKAVAIDGNLIVVAGTSNDGYEDAMAFARYLEDGSLDPTFGGDGKRTYAMSKRLVGVHRLAVLSDRKLSYGGTSVGPQWRMAIGRFNDDGSRDTTFPTFARDGFLSMRMPTTKSIPAPNLVLQADGKMLWLNEAPNRFTGDDDVVLNRWNADGTPDLTFGKNGEVTVRFSSGHDRVRDALVAPDGSIYVVGHYDVGNKSDVFLMRLTAEGRPYPGFGTKAQRPVTGLP